MITHEAFIHAVRDAALAHLMAVGPSNVAHIVSDTKLVYGLGHPGLRGVTHYGAWKNGHVHHFAEICAFGERDWIQLAGTTIHELAHTISQGSGHGKGWISACKKLGLRYVRAAGTNYSLGCFAPGVRDALAHMAKPDDGAPSRRAGINPNAPIKVRPCSAGIGTKGGTSRGTGSGSRLRKYECECGQIIRASTDTLEAIHAPCATAFKRAD